MIAKSETKLKKRLEDKTLIQYKTLLEAATDSVISIDAKGNITQWNKAAAKTFGYLAGEIIGQPVVLIIPERYRKRHEASMSRFRSTGKGRKIGKTVELFGLKKDKSEFPIELSLSTWTINGDIFFTAIIRDISQRLKKEAKHRKSVSDIYQLKKAQEKLARLASIVVNSNDAIIAKTLSGIITEWNKGAENIYGYKAKEVIGAPVSILLPPERANEIEQILAKVKHDEPVEHYETKRVRKDGHVIDVSVTVSPLKDKHGHIFGASAITRDISKRKQREKTILDQQQAIHELSTPVLPVKTEMLVLPLIGALDTFRARQMTMQLLNSIREQRAKVAVLDVTGVAGMDSAVANHLIQTVQAASLLGATVIITGISAENAQTLARLGVDLEGLYTYIDLQSGIEAAERILSNMPIKEAA